CSGEGVRVAVVDDGLEIAHEDLAANIATGQSYNYLDASSDPTPPNDVNSHGTKVGGIIAARDMNDLGVRGVAPRANLVGYNVVQSPTESNLAGAMTRGSPDVHVSSNSWGPIDGTGNPIASSFAWRTAITSGLTNGRDGKGTIYVWAGGNGANGVGPNIDNSNNDGQANNRGVIAVGAVTDQGIKAFYSEPGANVLVSAPAGELCYGHTISTTDLSGEGGDNTSITAGDTDYTDTNYTKCMNGTSAATPTISGVVALILQANPSLGWRDVRSILARTAKKNDAVNADWAVNDAGLDINHNYGFGVVDAGAAVSLATTWVNLTSEIMSASPLYSVNMAIPDDNATGIVDAVTISGSGISEIESIEITFSSDHAYTGDLEITLTHVITGITETVSLLSEENLCVRPCTEYNAWVFSSVRHLGEAADGDWTLTVKDLAPLDIGTFQSWSMRFYGT
ncbi:MAG: S8 family serine peptidase, partial [Gammaproteobacteria bacterium]